MSHEQKTQLDRIEEKLDLLLNGKIKGEDLVNVLKKSSQETPLPKETPFHKKP